MARLYGIGAVCKGETAVFTTDRYTLVAQYSGIYNEKDKFGIINETIPTGNTGGCANPKQVNDTFP